MKHFQKKTERTTQYNIWIRRALLEYSNVFLDQIFSLQDFNAKNTLKLQKWDSHSSASIYNLPQTHFVTYHSCFNK